MGERAGWGGRGWMMAVALATIYIWAREACGGKLFGLGSTGFMEWVWSLELGVSCLLFRFGHSEAV